MKRDDIDGVLKIAEACSKRFECTGCEFWAKSSDYYGVCAFGMRPYLWNIEKIRASVDTGSHTYKTRRL